MAKSELAAGELNKRVSIELPTLTENDYGEMVETGYTVVGKRWAAIKPMTGQEYQLAQQTQANITHIVEMRSDCLTRTLTPLHRLRHQGRLLNITRVFDVDEARKKVTLECKEAV